MLFSYGDSICQHVSVWSDHMSRMCELFTTQIFLSRFESFDSKAMFIYRYIACVRRNETQPFFTEMVHAIMPESMLCLPSYCVLSDRCKHRMPTAKYSFIFEQHRFERRRDFLPSPLLDALTDVERFYFGGAHCFECVKVNQFSSQTGVRHNL